MGEEAVKDNSTSGFWTRSRIAGLVLSLFLFFGFGWYVLRADKPWEAGVNKRIRQEKKVRVEDWVTTYSWCAAAFNLAIAACLLATFPVWTRPLQAPNRPGCPAPDGPPDPAAAEDAPPEAEAGPGPATRPRRIQRWLRHWWFWILLTAITAGGGYFQIKRLDRGVGGDAAYSLRRYSHGTWTTDPQSGEAVFREAPWLHTLYRTRGGNNHGLYSVASRSSLAAWRQFSGQGREEFNEAAFRAPVILAGLATVFLAGLLLYLFKEPIFGLGAAATLALHPWVQRYAVEGRGYALLLAFFLLSMIFLHAALRNRKWWAWAGYGAAQFGFLYSFAGAAYLAVALNLLVAAEIFFAERKSGRLLVVFSRWAVVNTLCVMALVQLLLPQVVQFSQLWGSGEFSGKMGADWLLDFWAHAAGGVPHNTTASSTVQFGVSLQLMGEKLYPLYWIGMGLIPAACVVGLFRALYGKPRTLRIMTLAVIFAAAMAYFLAARSGYRLFSWYFLYTVPVLLILMFYSMDWFTWILGNGKLRRVGEAILALGLVAIYAGFAYLPLDRLLRFERQPLKPAVEAVFGETAPPDLATRTDVLRAVFGKDKDNMSVYDPGVRVAKSVQDLRDILFEAEEKSLPFYVLYSNREAGVTDPELGPMISFVENPEVFEKVDYIKGIEEIYSWHIVKRKR